jgi:hypothetical protein
MTPNDPVVPVLREMVYDVGLPDEAVHDTVTRPIPAVAWMLLGTDGELHDTAGPAAGVELPDIQVPLALLALTT